MNQRNVEALARELMAILPPEAFVANGGSTIALLLASRGVLVPSALTDGDANVLIAIGEMVARGSCIENAAALHDDATEIRQELERIAKGEA